MENTPLGDQKITPSSEGHTILKHLRASIGTKIVLPYLLLTLIIAGVGAFIVVRLTTDSLKERFHNQLLDAGRIVSERMVDYEEERLKVLRGVVGTKGVAESLVAGDRDGLAVRVPQIIANSTTDAVELLDATGQEIYGWQRPPDQVGFEGEERSGADFSQMREVRRVLDGYVDEFGEKRVLLSQTPYGLMIFTLGPVYQGNQRVGAALVGTYIGEMVTDLSENALARVTLYDRQGQVIETRLGGGQKGVAELLQESPEQYQTILTLLRESSDRYPVVLATAEDEVPLRRVSVLGQEYTLAFGDWRLRSQSLGLFSVALPNNFIVSTAATSRNLLSLLFSVATVGVFILGFAIAQRIIRPIHRLVDTSNAVAEGDLARRSGIRRDDEIGSLARSFDTMTGRLAERTRQLVTQASKLAAILDSIGEGVIVLDQQGVVITINPVARQYLTDVSGDFLSDILQQLPASSVDPTDEAHLNQALASARLQQTQRYKIGKRVLSALTAPVKTPNGEILGTVIALRDVTREAEAEQLKDSFITSISHELRTPLTAVKGYSELLLLMADGSLGEAQLQSIQKINRNANVLLYHINQMIDISEIQAGTLKLNMETVELRQLVEQLTDKWREQMETKGLSLQVRLPEHELLVAGDHNRLNWALDNLLSNACNYTLAGGRVEVQAFQEGSEARVDVIDNGVGIDVADQPYLFTRFFRAINHQALYEVGGVGLGLFLTRSLIDQHGGRVWFKSKLDSGSTFSLALPLQQPEQPTSPPVNGHSTSNQQFEHDEHPHASSLRK
jgi:signal transduction histidine kinase